MTERPEELRPKSGNFTIIGSGVIGLLTAHELAKQGHNVKILSKEGQPDDAPRTASSIAGGQFLPWMHEGDMPDLNLNEVISWPRAFYEELARDSHETGVMAIENLELINHGTAWPAGLPEAMSATETTLPEAVVLEDATGADVEYGTAYRFNTFSINTPKTIAYLAKRAAEMGVKFEKREVTPEELAGLEGIIINAAGVGANKFDTEAEVKYSKGHTFVMRPKQGFEPPRQAISVDDLIIIPREDGTVICGALFIEDPDVPIPNEKEAEELKRRLSQLAEKAADLVDGLDPKLFENSEILLHSAAFRVKMANGNVRIAPDAHNERLLHAYGFSSIGWSVGPHFAKQIAAQAIAMQNSRADIQ